MFVIFNSQTNKATWKSESLRQMYANTVVLRAAAECNTRAAHKNKELIKLIKRTIFAFLNSELAPTLYTVTGLSGTFDW